MSAAQSPAAKTCRVVQWATGNVGARSLRTLIEHPDLELVDLYVYGETKAGRDAGELCALPPIGVQATRNVHEILALKTACVLYMPQTIAADHPRSEEHSAELQSLMCNTYAFFCLKNKKHPLLYIILNLGYF